MKRRIFSVLLAVLLLIPWTFASAATAPVVITSEDVRGKVGDTVAVTLNVVVEPPKLNQTMDSLQFVLEYDSAALEFDSIQEISGDKINILGAQFICSVTTKPGAVAFTAAATRNQVKFWEKAQMRQGRVQPMVSKITVAFLRP
ncbi:MAG: hypothetical protein IJC00_03765, partial [Clostridia bacterium]|nr:hypothetical protein [Clostridia bacterium]